MNKNAEISVGLSAPGWAQVNRYNLLFLSLGAVINVLSYMSLDPLIVASMFYFTASVLMKLTPLGGSAEQRMFNRVFSVGFLVAGVAAVYANQLYDSGQLYSDAGGFYDISLGRAADLTLDEIERIHTGSLAIVLWQNVYDFFEALGFQKARHIGITLNITAVALSGVIGIKMIRQVFGNDESRFRRLILIVSACGLFWSFAGIHLRDAFVLLVVTVLAYSWLYFLANPSFGWRLIQVVILSLIGFVLMGFLRTQFVFIPVVMALIASMSMLIGGDQQRKGLVVNGIIIVSVGIATVLLVNFADEIFAVLDHSHTSYTEKTTTRHGDDSLGIALIMNQPIPVRLVLSSIYLLIFPIPFWSGLQLESAYHLFTSANVLFMYVLLPLLYIAILKLFHDKSLRKPSLLFILFLVLGSTLGVAGTSMVARHFGAFLMPFFILAVLPNLSDPQTWRRYKASLKIFLFGMFFIHLAWIVLKLF